MKENIETKDVQRTEYLDKNGLDMLWAKVKENTHNQVEVERNRAVAKENSIIDTKADKSALDNYVLSAALAEYAKKTDIPEVDTSDFVSKTATDAQIINSTLSVHDTLYINPSDDSQYHAILDPESIQIVAGDLEGNGTITGVAITANERDPYIALTDSDNVNTLKITREGISNTDNNANHVFATDGSIADLTQYAKKGEIADKADKTDLTQLQTTVNGKQDKPASGYSYITAKYDSSNFNYTVRCNYIAVTDDRATTAFSPVGVSILGSSTSMYITHDGIKLNGAKYKETEVFNVKGGTIDTTVFALKSELDSYAKKSVYDEKIAALEARVAALEAKHAEAV